MVSTTFIDQSFPANTNSVFTKPNSFKYHLKWKRLEDIIPPGTDLISNASSSDILQGKLGDCWFLASLAAIAERKQFLKNLFVNEKVNAEGKYSFRFNIDGMDKIVTIDSFLPMLSDTTLYSARAHHGHYWVALVEKAFAKEVGGYDRMESGDCEEALRTFTGCPTNTLDEKMEAERYWAKLSKFGDGGSSAYLLTCGISLGTNEHPLSSEHLRNGLLTEHVYTVLDVARHTETNTRLIKLRNPWGAVEFRGDWSDDSPRWTPELRAFFGSRKDFGDGVFHISFEDFRSNFNVVSYCYTNDLWKSARIQSYFEEEQNRAQKKVLSPTIEMRLGGDCAVHLAIHQHDERKENALKHVDIGAIIVDAESNLPVKILDFKLKRVSQKKMNLKAGRYHVLPYTSGVHFESAPFTNRRDFVMSAHSAEEKPRFALKEVEDGRTERAFAAALIHLSTETQVAPDGSFALHQLSSRDLMAVGLERRSSCADRDIICLQLDPSESCHIVPTLNSLKSMSTINLLFNAERGVFVAKFIREGNMAYDFSLKCNLVQKFSEEEFAKLREDNLLSTY